MKIKIPNFLKETWLLVTLVIVFGSAAGVGIYYDEYMEEFKRQNEEFAKKDDILQLSGLEFKKIGDYLFTLTGDVAPGDCEKIVPMMEPNMTVILESPGGSLADGGCIAGHFKIRNVQTVVRDTPVYDELGKVIYQPGLISKDPFTGKTVCASSCSIMFLGGDDRWLIGDVLFGIHGPATPAPMLQGKAPVAIESSAFATAAALFDLLTTLGITDDQLKLFFIRVPNSTMYWLKPSDFERMPSLATIATHYRGFWGLTITHKLATLPN